MDIQTVVYAALVLFVAYLVRGIAGFGSGLIAVPMLTLVAPVPLVVPLVVSLEANRAFVAERLRTDPAWPLGLVHGEALDVAGFRITALAVAHEQLDTDELGRHHHLGYLVAAGPFLLFHSGDAVPYEGMDDELLRLTGDIRLDVALLPINGRLPERRVPGNFWGDEAATFANRVGARLVVPMHFEMFAFNTETPELFATTADSSASPTVSCSAASCSKITKGSPRP